MSLDHLYQQLNYHPNNHSLFEQAVTHRSFSRDHNERLEFLGDAVLDLVIGEALYHQWSDRREGELSRYRAELVNGSYLANKARHLKLNQVIRLGSGERKTGGAERESIMAGTFEAIFGAIYLDAGYEVAKNILLSLFAEDIQHIGQRANNKDAKTRLQEWVQANKKGLPVYTLLRTCGQDHQQIFTMQCEITGLALKTVQEGSSKKMAEQLAAENMLSLLEQRINQ